MRTERERSYYYPSIKKDRSPNWPQRPTRIKRTRNRIAQWLYGGSLAITLSFGGKALLATISTSHTPAVQISTPKQEPQPAHLQSIQEQITPAATRPAPPATTVPPPPPAKPTARPRRPLRECMAPGSNEINTKVLACMNGTQ